MSECLSVKYYLCLPQLLSSVICIHSFLLLIALQRYRTHSDIIVKETPIKKQVDNYRRFNYRDWGVFEYSRLVGTWCKNWGKGGRGEGKEGGERGGEERRGGERERREGEEKEGGERKRREGGLVGTTVYVQDYQGGLTMQTYLICGTQLVGGWLDGASSWA